MKRAQSQWQAAILVCGKCSKKIGGGFGPKGRTSLAKALREEGGGGKSRKAALGVIETGCLKICPKKAVVALNGAHPQDWVIVPQGADIEAVRERLGAGRKDPSSASPPTIVSD